MKYYTTIAAVALLNGAEAIKVEREPLLSAPQRTEWAFTDQKKKGPDYPVDYFVPNFGEDKEISQTKLTIRDTENRMNHKIKVSTKKDKEPTYPQDYAVPDFGQDADVKVTLKNAQNAEK